MLCISSQHADQLPAHGGTQGIRSAGVGCNITPGVFPSPCKACLSGACSSRMPPSCASNRCTAYSVLFSRCRTESIWGAYPCAHAQWCKSTTASPVSAGSANLCYSSVDARRYTSASNDLHSQAYVICRCMGSRSAGPRCQQHRRQLKALALAAHKLCAPACAHLRAPRARRT